MCAKIAKLIAESVRERSRGNIEQARTLARDALHLRKLCENKKEGSDDECTNDGV